MTETHTPENLIGGAKPLMTEAVTIASGQALPRGAALGCVLFALGAPAADGGNTGDGPCVAALPASGEEPHLGDYAVTCEAVAGADPAAFRFVTPKTPQGVLVAANGQPHVVDGVQVTLTEGGTGFDVGDEFTFALAAGSGQCKQLDKSNQDGSQRLHAILAEDVDATEGARAAIGYIAGEFNAAAVGFADGDSAADFAVDARLKGIHFRTNIAVPTE